MAFDQTNAGDGHSRDARTGSRVGLLYFLAAALVSMLFGGIFMVLTAIVVRLTAESQSQTTKVAVVIAGAAVGAIGSGWMIQPGLTRHLTQLVSSVGHKGTSR